jgi:hypothetical protein
MVGGHAVVAGRGEDQLDQEDRGQGEEPVEKGLVAAAVEFGRNKTVGVSFDGVQLVQDEDGDQDDEELDVGGGDADFEPIDPPVFDSCELVMRQVAIPHRLSHFRARSRPS